MSGSVSSNPITTGPNSTNGSNAQVASQPAIASNAAAAAALALSNSGPESQDQAKQLAEDKWQLIKSISQASPIVREIISISQDLYSGKPASKEEDAAKEKRLGELRNQLSQNFGNVENGYLLACQKVAVSSSNKQPEEIFFETVFSRISQSIPKVSDSEVANQLELFPVVADGYGNYWIRAISPEQPRPYFLSIYPHGNPRFQVSTLPRFNYANLHLLVGQIGDERRCFYKRLFGVADRAFCNLTGDSLRISTMQQINSGNTLGISFLFYKFQAASFELDHENCNALIGQIEEQRALSKLNLKQRKIELLIETTGQTRVIAQIIEEYAHTPFIFSIEQVAQSQWKFK